MQNDFQFEGLQETLLRSERFCLLDNFPLPIYQRGPHCKLMMLFYLMDYQRLNSPDDKPSPSIPPLRKKMYVKNDHPYFTEQAQQSGWEFSKQRSGRSAVTDAMPELAFLFNYRNPTSLRAQAKGLGSMVGEIYDPRILTTLAKQNGFERAGFYQPEKADYIDTIKNCLHRGVPVGVFFDIDNQQVSDTKVVNKGGQFEHASMVIGYFFDNESKQLHFVLVNWGAIAFIEADKLLESTYQLMETREPEVFVYTFNHPSKWVNTTAKRARVFGNDTEMTRTARELLPNAVSMRGKIFVLETDNHHKPYLINIEVNDISQSARALPLNNETIIVGYDYTSELAKLKKASAEAYASFDDSDTEVDWLADFDMPDAGMSDVEMPGDGLDDIGSYDPNDIQQDAFSYSYYK